MKLNQLLGAVAVAAGLLSAGSASAELITGSLGYTSIFGFTSDDSNLTLATSITHGASVLSGTVDGTFAAEGLTPGTPVALFNPLSVNTAAPLAPMPLPAGPIWSVGGFTMTLTLMFEKVGNTASTLDLEGLGIISHPDYEDTVGRWTATYNAQGSNFTFSSSSTTEIPEGGATLALLGLGLLGLEGARRRLKAAKA
jgi:hypothetical protein